MPADTVPETDERRQGRPGRQSTCNRNWLGAWSRSA